MLKTVGKSLAAVLRAAGGHVPALVRDVFGVAGVGAIAYGAWLIYEPAGFIVGGALVLAGVLLSAMRG